VGVQTPKGVIEKKVEKGIEPKSQAAIVFTGPFEYDQARAVAIGAMTELLQTRLLEKLREDLGGTYSITVSPEYQKIPKQEYSVTIQFGSDPQRSEELVKRVFQEIEDLKANGPTVKQLNDVKEALLRGFETSSKQNNFLLNQISLKYQVGEDPASIWQLPELYKKLDAATIKQAAKTYLNTNNFVRVTLFPEKK
jgi:zinc protease